MSIASTNMFAFVAPEGDEIRPLGALLEFAPGAMIWTLIAFAIGLVFMWKFVYGPITTALEDRDQKVEDSIKAAEVARQEAEAQMTRAKAELAEAQANRQKPFAKRMSGPRRSCKRLATRSPLKSVRPCRRSARSPST